MDFKDYYQNGSESARLIEYSLEKLRTQELLKRFISQKSSRILDIGGGTGIYSFWLSEQGHEVHLVDIVPLHIQQAKEFSQKQDRQLASMMIGDACSLNFDDNSFDYVLMLGPLYHLMEKEKRLKALQEAKRVLKSGGTIFCVGISQFASMMDGFYENLIEDPDFIRIMNQDLENSQHCNLTNNPWYFTTAYFHNPQELKNEVESSGFTILGQCGIESFGRYIPDICEKLKNEEYRKILFKTIEKVESEITLLGMSNHVMVVGKK